MTVVSICLFVALVISLLTNFFLIDRLEEANKRLEEMQDERYW